MAMRGKRAVWWGSMIAGVLALSACAGSATTTATPPRTAAPGTPALGANIAPAASPTTTLTLTPQTTVAPSPPVTNANAATPTPLVNGLLTPTAEADTADATAASTATIVTTANTATSAPNTPVTGSTGTIGVSGNAATAASGGVSTTTSATAVSSTRAAATTPAAAATTSALTTPSVTSAPTATTAASHTATTTSSATATTARASATAANETPAPPSGASARAVAQQFLNAVLKKGDVSGYLTPALRSQGGGDGNKLLGISGSIAEYTIDSDKSDADGTSTVVHVTIKTGGNSSGRDFRMKNAGGMWLIDNITT